MFYAGMNTQEHDLQRKRAVQARVRHWEKDSKGMRNVAVRGVGKSGEMKENGETKKQTEYKCIRERGQD